MQKPMETSGFGRQDSSGPHTLGMLHASTTQLLATRSHLPAAAAHVPAPAAATMLADLTATSAVAEWAPAAADDDDISGDAGAELEMTPPPRTPAAQPQVRVYCVPKKLVACVKSGISLNRPFLQIHACGQFKPVCIREVLYSCSQH